MKTIVAADLRH